MKKIAISAALAMLLLACARTGSADIAPAPVDADAYFRSGEAHFAADELDLAIADFEAGEYERAFADASRTAEITSAADNPIEPDLLLELHFFFIEAYLSRADLHYETGAYQLAVADLTRSLNFDPYDDYARERLEEIVQLAGEGAD